MVAELLVLVDRLATGLVGHGWRGQVVVQTPAHVLGIGLATVAPPGVGGVGGVGLQAAVHVHQTTIGQHAGHPGALFGQKAAVFLVAFPVLQVDLLVRDVDVAAQDELALGLQALQHGVEAVQKAELGLLPLGARGAAGKVAADDGELAPGGVEAGFDVAALCVEFGHAKARDDIAGGVSRVYADTGVALLLGQVKVAPHAGQLLEAPGQVALLGLDLLHANTIRRVRLQPGFDPLGRGRADAVEVETGELEQGNISNERDRDGGPARRAGA